MLKIENISVGYSTNNNILKDLSFAIDNKEIICIMGESGSGKSTLLKAIYGLLDLNKGQINWNDKPITGPKENLIPGVSDFKYVPQNFDLMPYISTSENIGKYLSRFDIEHREYTIKNMLDVVELTPYASEKVINLSGGQQQRVAIARALATEPKLLLLDEPFGQIDTFKKNNLRRNLFRSLKEQNIPCIIATHDGEDALSFADRLIILKDGKIVINMNPREFYENPKDKYAAALLDDINEIIVEDKTYLSYPNQLKIVDKSILVAKVLKSYYRGSNWLIECFYNERIIFISHSKDIETNTEVFFKFKSKPTHL